MRFQQRQQFIKGKIRLPCGKLLLVTRSVKRHL